MRTVVVSWMGSVVSTLLGMRGSEAVGRALGGMMREFPSVQVLTNTQNVGGCCHAQEMVDLAGTVDRFYKSRS